MSEATPTPGDKRTALEAAKLNGSQEGKVFLITGAYSGIGVETTKALLEVGGSVICGGRNEQALTEFMDKLKKEYDASRVDGYVVDLADLESVKEFCDKVNKKYQTLDVVILNAGVMNTPPGLTKDGFEMQIGTNVVGHFLLAKLLVPKTKRQVWVSSAAHMRYDGARFDIEAFKNFDVNDTSSYDGFAQYQQSKIGDIMLAKEFARRYPPLEAVSLHPGVIKTNLGRHMNIFELIPLVFSIMWRGLSMKTVEQGAATNVTCATLSNVENGAYYFDCEVAQEVPNSKLEEDNAALFDYCDDVTKKVSVVWSSS